MLCPFCQASDTKVLDSRLMHDGRQVKRRRVCQVCEARFNTFERMEGVMPRVVKRDGMVVAFDEEKLRRGLARAFKKRPVSEESFERWISDMMANIRAEDPKEVASSVIGAMVLEKLKSIDAIAYVRFASVYDGFSNIGDFQDLIKRVAREEVPILQSNEVEV